MGVRSDLVATIRAPDAPVRVLLLVPAAGAVATALVLLYLANPLAPPYLASGTPGVVARRDLLGLAFFAYQLLAPLALTVLVLMGARRSGVARVVVGVACGAYAVVSLVVLVASVRRTGWALSLVPDLPVVLVAVLVPFAGVLLVLRLRRGR